MIDALHAPSQPQTVYTLPLKPFIPQPTRDAFVTEAINKLKKSKLRGHLYLPFPTEWNGMQLRERNEREQKFWFSWTLPSIVFDKIAIVFSDQ
uniref:Ribulose-bisphosphate carboxylase n=1 Tax=Romanomermis culicivorax TaxID=13658 RepID=A0A915KRU3_ROMCU